MTVGRFRTLVDLFSRRFFENDLLAPDIDLRPAAVWLVGAMLAPSLFWTAKRAVPFGFMAVLGPEAMEAASWFDKSLLMTLAMINAGVVTLLTWEALLVDRRDAHVLGSLPLRPEVIVAAKGAALLRLLVIVAALNVPAAFVHAFEVYSHIDIAMVPRVFVVHSAAATMASLATSSLLMALMVGVTTLARGAALRVVTVGIQALVLGALTALLIGLQWTPAVPEAARTGDQGMLGWLVAWPPFWFLSLYQAMLPVELGRGLFGPHASKALMLAAAAMAAIPMTLLLWRHALSAMVSATTEEPSRRQWGSASRLASLFVRRPTDRALVQFFLAALARSPRHRLAVVTALGLSVALGFEATLLLSTRSAGSGRWVTEFAGPVLVALLMTSTARWLVTLPAELNASWVLGSTAPFGGTSVWRAMHRVLVLLVVVPSTSLAMLLSVWQGGIRSALAHAGLVALLGLGLVERTLAKLTFLPFASEYVPGRSNLRARWPIHVVVLLIVVPTIGQLERSLITGPPRRWLTLVGLGAAAVAMLVIRRRRRLARLTTEADDGVAWTPVTLNIGQTLMPEPRALQ